MTVTLEVGAETLAQARQAAQLEGISLEQYLSEMVEDTFAYDAAKAEVAAGAVARPLADVLHDIEARRTHESANGEGSNGASNGAVGDTTSDIPTKGTNGAV